MNLAATMSLDNRGFVNPLAGAQTAMRGMMGQLKELSGTLAAVAGLTAGFFTLKTAMTKAAASEDLHASFAVLLHDANAATQAMEDLKAFSDVTPFEPGPVMEAGRALLAYGFTVNNLKPILRDVGDLAAGMQKPLEEVAGVFGRIRAGDLGESMRQLREMGISRQDFEKQGLRFDKSGELLGSANQVMDALRQIIRTKFGGSMQVLSTTTNGLLSTLRGRISGLMAELGRPLNDVFKPLLQNAIAWTTKLQAEIKNLRAQWAIMFDSEKTVNFGNGVVGKVKTKGLFTNIGEAFGVAFQVGITQAINYLVKNLKGAVNVFKLIFADTFANGSLQGILTSTFKLAANSFGVLLLSAFRPAIAYLQAGVATALAKLPGGGKKEREDAKREMQALNPKIQAAQDEWEKANRAGNKPGADQATEKLRSLSTRWQELEPYASGKRTMNFDAYFKKFSENPALLGKTKADMGKEMDEAGAQLTASLKAFAAEAPKSWQTIKETFQKSLNGPDVVKLPPAVQKQWADLIAKLTRVIPATLRSPETAAGDKPGAAGEVGRAPKIEGDRLAKIGGFIGGGGPALDYARRTADGVTRLVALMAGLKSAQPGYAATPAWAS